MQLRTVIISGGVHLAVGWSLMHAEEQRLARKPTEMSVVDSKPEKKKELPPKPPPPPPPPKPAVPHPVAATAPAAVAPMAPAAMAAPEAAGSGIHLSNDGPGLAIGGLPPAAKAAKVEVAKPKAATPKPQVQTQAAGPAECTEEATKPVPVVKNNPEYTDAARASGVEGRLVVRIYVGADGSVTKVEVVTSVDAALDAASIATIQKWRFTPALKCGKPVDGGVYVFAQRFELAGD